MSRSTMKALLICGGIFCLAMCKLMHLQGADAKTASVAAKKSACNCNGSCRCGNDCQCEVCLCGDSCRCGQVKNKCGPAQSGPVVRSVGYEHLINSAAQMSQPASPADDRITEDQEAADYIFR